MRIDTQTVAHAVIMIPHSWLMLWLIINMLFVAVLLARLEE